MARDYSRFLNALKERAKKVEKLLFTDEYHHKFSPNHLNKAVYSYFHSGGKCLRPAIVLFSCGAVGGDETLALNASASLEAYHTWTLVHDDILDRDELRRGGMSVHTQFKNIALEEMKFSLEEAIHYGISMGILAGDIQHGWAIALMCKTIERGVEPELIIEIIRELEEEVLPSLLEGETLDIQYTHLPIKTLKEAKILRMLWKKTGVLYRFAGSVGARIGISQTGGDPELVKAISGFTSRCGLAFQMIDDILGLTGDEKVLGKPIGSDIREGKRTIPIYCAWQNSDKKTRDFIENTLGNPDAEPEDINKLLNIIKETDGIDYTFNIAKRLVKKGLKKLEIIPESRYKDFMRDWASYIIDRDF
jgi:geranylgeranyl diphosphate synthase type I